MTPETPRTTAVYRAVMVTASGGAFLAMLDTNVTNLAFTSLEHDFPHASVADLSWVVSAYAVMFAALLAPAGRLTDVLGRRRAFAAGVGLFATASLVAATAPNIPVLVTARALQGAGAAAMIPASLAILLLDGPADRRARSVGVWSAASAIGAVAGPVVGGSLVDAFGWRSVFLINIPIGVALVRTALRLLVPATMPADAQLPDSLGIACVAVGIGGLALGITQLSSWGLADPRTPAALVIGVASLVFAVWRSRRHPAPAIETALWRSRAFVATNVTTLFYGMAQFSFSLGSILYLTGIWRYSVLQAGLSNVPGAVAAAIVAVVMGRLAVRLGGPRFAILFGLIVYAAGILWLTVNLTDHPAFLTVWLPAALLVGTGLGSASMGVAASATLSAPPVQYASASGLNTTARQAGGALGIAIMATILEHRAATDGVRGVGAYRAVDIYCLIMVLLALAVATAFVRPARPASVDAKPLAATTATTATDDTSED